MIIIYSTAAVRILTFGSRGTSGITLFPFIFLVDALKGSDNALYIINHERIHIRQELELLLVFFALIYLVNYLYWRVRGHSHADAYRKIIFESEAYEKMYDLNYLKNRKLFGFIRK
jgi:hypothetical protein